ncbi:hypothetical protein [Streptomyces bikiniensis]|uniref:hypothetical protein n=1 Tax=Streptomyces bikiniensis TaxID=1896 RepID=UPI00068C68F2|nr:hypothetical protein [Streptomyces bikiniensis]
MDPRPSPGFTSVLGGLHITGLPAPDADEGDHPALFVLLGHRRWVTAIQAADLYMRRVQDCTRWCLYPDDDPGEVIPRIPRALHTHAAIHCHPDGTWNLAWARPDEPGAIPVTGMRHSATPAAAVAVPNPNLEPQPATWAR